MQFIGRKKEISLINKMFASDDLELAVIYGRRRIGKSELIKYCLSSSSLDSIFYECLETNETQNVESLGELILKKWGLEDLSLRGIKEVLTFVFKKSIGTPLILVLDEYPYLREKVTGLDSIIKALIDEYKDSSQLKLILCGSYIDIMKSLFEHDNPLYGRISLKIELKQMDYYDSFKFYEGFCMEDKVRLYSVFGGIPYYNRLIDKRMTFKENIINLIASKNSRLESEISIYLKNELNKLENANAVIDILAKGVTKYKDILSYSNISSSPTLADVLNKLQKLELVKKETAINNHEAKGSYYICDNLTLFYYRYIFRNSSILTLMDPGIFYDEFISRDFEDQYVPKMFEMIAKQFLIRLNLKGRCEPPFYAIGKYIFNDRHNKINREFNVVTLDKNGYISYEAKYKNRPLNDYDIKEEIEQVSSSDLKAYRYGFFSKSGFKLDDKRKDLILYTLEDMVKEDL